MKIVLLGPVYPFRGGIAHHTAMLAQALARRHDLLVISFRRQFPRWLYPGRTDRDPSKQPLAVGAEFILDPLAPWTWCQAADRLAKFKPGLVLMQWWTTFLAPMDCALGMRLRSLGIPLVSLVHNALPHGQRPWDRPLARLGLSASRACLVHTTQEELHIGALLPGMLTVVYPLPRYDSLVTATTDRTLARSELDLPHEGGVLLFFGLIRPYKGLMTLLQAMVLLKERLPDLTLLVVGEFWGDKNQYLEFIEQNRLAQRVRVIEGYVPNEALGMYFSACDLVVLPYTEATQSGVIQLAFSLGVPVVSTRVGGLAEMVDHGRTGLLVEPHDPQAIAEAVMRFHSEPGLAEAMRGAIGRTAGQNTWAGLVTQVEKIASILG